MAKASSKQREVVILVRYQFKQDAFVKELNAYVKKGDVVLLVQNDKGARYYVTLRRGGTHACTCPSRKPCYHIGHCRTVENERAKNAAQLAAQRKAEQDEQELEAIVAQVEYELAQEAKAATATQARDTATRGNLNGSRAFSLMR